MWRYSPILLSLAALAACFRAPRLSTGAASVPLSVLTVHADDPSLAVIDLENGSVTEYPPAAHALSGDAVDGAVITSRGDTSFGTTGPPAVHDGLTSVDRT